MSRWIVVAVVFAVGPTPGTPLYGDQHAPRLRRPMAMVLADDGKSLFVANQRSGSISVIDVGSRSVVAEVDVAGNVTDLIGGWDDSSLLATDEAGHRLLRLRIDAPGVRVVNSVAVSKYPVSVVVNRARTRAYVASLWSRRLSIVDLPRVDSEPMRVLKTLDLPFAPGKQLFIHHRKCLIVADAFGDRLAIVDTDKDEIDQVRRFPAHNIRGLALSPDREMLMITHQMLNDLAHTTRNDIHWGLVMSNDLRWMKLDVLLGDGDNLYTGGHMHPLGDAGNAAGDPAGFALAADGTAVVAIGGSNEIALVKKDKLIAERLDVGKRPTAVVIDASGELAYVSNTFDDSISVVAINGPRHVATIDLGRKPKLTLIDEGELLFYDARLSHDRWMSCHSCHTDGHTNGQLNDNFSDASFGAPKRVLSLLGRAETEPYAWDGKTPSLPEQIRQSIRKTMQGPEEPEDRVVAALAAYVDTLAAPPSIDAARGIVNNAVIARGRDLFLDQRCDVCHTPPTYTSPRSYNVGLTDQEGNKRFNPPTLRGVGQRGSLFHDNRAESLRDVFVRHEHKLRRPLSAPELDDLLAFLRSL